MESVGHKSGRLERPFAWNGQETLEKTWKNAASQGEKAVKHVKHGEKVEKCRVQGRAGRRR